MKRKAFIKISNSLIAEVLERGFDKAVPIRPLLNVEVENASYDKENKQVVLEISAINLEQREAGKDIAPVYINLYDE